MRLKTQNTDFSSTCESWNAAEPIEGLNRLRHISISGATNLTFCILTMKTSKITHLQQSCALWLGLNPIRGQKMQPDSSPRLSYQDQTAQIPYSCISEWQFWPEVSALSYQQHKQTHTFVSEPKKRGSYISCNIISHWYSDGEHPKMTRRHITTEK